MLPEHININGVLKPASSCGVELLGLTRSNYTYRNIHTSGHKPLHLSAQLELLELSCEALFGSRAGLSAPETEKRIAELLYRNSAPEGSNLIRIVVLPDITHEGPAVYIFYMGPMVYQGYCLWHKPLRAVTLTYEIPFPSFKTSANLLSHDYSQEHARRLGYDCAVSVNYAGNAVSVGENPLFCVQGRDVFTSDAEVTFPQSVERMLGIELCLKAGLRLYETPVSAESLNKMDELFSVTPQGIVPIGSVGDHLFTPSISKVLERFLPRMAVHEFPLNNDIK